MYCGIINGKKIKASKYTYEELYNIYKEKTPPKLETILEYNNGKVGIVVDAKDAHIFYPKYRKNLVKLLNQYGEKGEIMLQSFNPIFMLSLKNKLKGVLTCQLICRAKTLLDEIKAPKSLAILYERIISLICIISGTDVINMENHSNIKWQSRFKIVKYNKIEDCIFKDKKRDITKKITRVRMKINHFLDNFQIKFIKLFKNITKVPILAFTIENDDEYDVMSELNIANYIVDFSNNGVAEYIKKITSN